MKHLRMKKRYFVVVDYDYGVLFRILPDLPDLSLYKAVWEADNPQDALRCEQQVIHAIAPIVLRKGIAAWKHIRELIRDSDVPNPVEEGKQGIAMLHNSCALCHLVSFLRCKPCSHCPLGSCLASKGSAYSIARSDKHSLEDRLQACDNIIAAHYKLAKSMGVELKDARKSLRTLLETVEGGKLVWALV